MKAFLSGILGVSNVVPLTEQPDGMPMSCAEGQSVDGPTD